MAKKLTNAKLGIYLFVFFAVWTIRELVFYPMLLEWLGNGVAFQFVESAIKLLVWTLPALLLIRHYEADLWLGLKAQFINRPKWFREAPLLLVVFVPILRSLLFNRGFAVSPAFEPAALIGTVLFVGITEEIVFRGWLLNAQLKRMKLWPAIAVNGVLFVVIHYPIWITHGHDISVFLLGSVSIFLLSAVFSYSFVKTKNIFVPIVLHMLWNLFVGLLG